MIRRLKYPSSLVLPNPLCPNSSLLGCRRKVTGPLSTVQPVHPEEYNSAQGVWGRLFATVPSLAKTLLLFLEVSRQFLQVHDQFWTIKQCQIKRNENTVSSSSQLEKIKYLCVCFMCCTYLTLGGSCRSQGFEIQREGNISTWLLSLLLLHMWEFPLSSLLCPLQNSFSFWLRNIDVSAIYCSPGSFPLLCLPTQQFFPRCKETWLEEFL